jgi:mannose-6-phosphate isomerase-like protein (cupin superfamily)
MRRVEKPWGYEIIWAECDKYVGKILHINPQSRLSRQYHEVKEETILVNSGVLRLEIGKDQDIEVRYMGVGETFHVTPGTVHRFCSNEVPVELIEVSTPHLDDVVRITDDYQRLS